jgi:mannose-1-phosphate guanylyltransferase/mannose-6-phosphate isomerase
MAEFLDVRAVILAGGSGTRLWPLSRLQAPKQFLQLIGEDTLLEATVNRLSPLIPKSQVVIVTNEETANGAGYRALAPYERILEPVARNTAAAIGAAAVRYRLEGIDPVLVVLPSDHLIRDVPAFQTALGLAVEAAESGKLVTFGIRPTGPETGFGYIQSGSGGSLREVKAFHEKPDLATAKRFVESGDYFWNSGMFVWRASAILREIESTLPALHEMLATLGKDSHDVAGFAPALKRHFGSAPSISIDHGVLEKSRNLFMVPGDFGWSDVGSWDAVYDISEKDGDLNSVQGNVVAIDCRNTLVRSHDRLVAVVDVEDISVIETPDAVLVMRRGASQNVRKVVERLCAGNGTEHILHATVQRPWGSYTVLEEGPGFKIKRIDVAPGGRLSLQRHQHRSEHWVVIEGAATVTSDGAVATLTSNQSTFIPIGTKHRLENLAAVPLQIIEVQVGTYVGEDDIQRFDDQYGRSNEVASSK